MAAVRVKVKAASGPATGVGGQLPRERTEVQGHQDAGQVGSGRMGSDTGSRSEAQVGREERPAESRRQETVTASSQVCGGGGG